MQITGHPNEMTTSAPTGITIARYATYNEAQRAIDHLADERFPVEQTTIVGRELQQVEQITGRLTWTRAIAAGAATGAWFGLFVGVLLGLFTAGGTAWVAAVLTGVVLGAIFGAIGYAQVAGRRDFRSRTSIIAGCYDVLCDAAHAAEARDRLGRLALSGQVNPQTPPQQPGGEPRQ